MVPRSDRERTGRAYLIEVGVGGGGPRAEATGDGVGAALRRQSSRHGKTRAHPSVSIPLQPDGVPPVFPDSAQPKPARRTDFECFLVFLIGPVFYTQKPVETLQPNKALRFLSHIFSLFAKFLLALLSIVF